MPPDVAVSGVEASTPPGPYSRVYWAVKRAVWHELEGRSFKEMAAETGVSVNTLLSRKRYAVLHLRQRLQSIYDEFTKA